LLEGTILSFGPDDVAKRAGEAPLSSVAQPVSSIADISIAGRKIWKTVLLIQFTIYLRIVLAPA